MDNGAFHSGLACTILYLYQPQIVGAIWQQPGMQSDFIIIIFCGNLNDNKYLFYSHKLLHINRVHLQVQHSTYIYIGEKNISIYRTRSGVGWSVNLVLHIL